MEADDFLEPEVAVAVAVTAAVCSPPVRKVLRKGLVYGLAGLIIARDKVSNAAKVVKKNVQQVAASAGNGTPETSNPAAVAPAGASASS